ncbi:hypothetical protein [Nocardia sp. XZ_19_231]|uniref:hypothetical protein n=1 Tax=Nocardia sp. XZ_19_231 TaxID=2769252 RepID=UPI00188EFAA6|nr:hypothetical protein [Nocardia sp. XZ_19_231]
MSTQTPTDAGLAAAAVVMVVRDVVVVGGFEVVVSVADAARGAGFGVAVPHPAETSATATTAGSV